MKHPLPSIFFIGVVVSGLSHAATVHLGPYQTVPATSNASGSVNQSVSYTIDLSNLTGLTLGAPIQIDFTTDAALIWSGTFMAQTGDLGFAWRAEMEISVGGFSTTFADISSFGPIPFVNDPSVFGYGAYEIGPAPVTRSLVVPWGTDLGNLTFTLWDRSRILSGVPGFSLTSSVEGAGGTFTTRSVEVPEISIEQGAGNLLANQDAVDFGATVPGRQTSLTFTIRNIGASPLILSGADFSIPTETEFCLAAPVTGTVAAGGSLDFIVNFTPTASGIRESILTLLNNDSDESAFRLGLSGNALSFAIDTDTDGLSDAAEFNLAALGFDWDAAQTELVATFFANASGAGLFTASQLQTMHSDAPLIAKDPATGKFKLTMDWKKSTNLTDFLDFPAPAGSAVSITPQGDVELEFPSTDNAAFFRIEVE